MRTNSQKYNDRIELWQLISRYLDQLGWSPAFLAGITGIDASYISHLKRGRRGLTKEHCENLYRIFEAAAKHSFYFDSWEFCRIAHLDYAEMTSDPTGNNHNYRTVLFDSELLLVEWGKDIPLHYFNLYQQGQAIQVEAVARSVYNALLKGAYPTDDVFIARLIIEYGLLIGQAQELRYPWHMRLEAALQTYHDIETRMSDYLTLPEDPIFLRLHARLCLSRGALLREIGESEEIMATFNDGIRSAEKARDRFLLAALYRNKGHVYAVQGKIKQWESSLKVAETLSNRDPWLKCLYEVMQGNGFKRLAYNSHLKLFLKERKEYAMQALTFFAEAERLVPYPVVHMHTLGVDGNVYFRRLFRAQCLVWVDPDQALEELVALREEKDVRMKFPSMLMKIAYAEFTAICLRGWDEKKLPPVFNLDKDHINEAFQEYYAAWQKTVAYSEVYV